MILTLLMTSPATGLFGPRASRRATLCALQQEQLQYRRNCSKVASQSMGRRPDDAVDRKIRDFWIDGRDGPARGLSNGGDLGHRHREVIQPVERLWLDPRVPRSSLLGSWPERRSPGSTAAKEDCENPVPPLFTAYRRHRPTGRRWPRVASPFTKEVARSRPRAMARSRATCVIVSPVQAVSSRRRREGRLR